MWEGIKETFSGIWKIITGIFNTQMNVISSGLNTIIKGINAAGQGKVNIPLIPMLAEGGILTSGAAIVGEAGPEFVQVSNGQAMVQPLGSSGGDISALLETYLPYLAAGNQLVLDSGALVGGIAPDMNVALGTLAIRGGRR